MCVGGGVLLKAKRGRGKEGGGLALGKNGTPALTGSDCQLPGAGSRRREPCFCCLGIPAPSPASQAVHKGFSFGERAPRVFLPCVTLIPKYKWKPKTTSVEEVAGLGLSPRPRMVLFAQPLVCPLVPGVWAATYLCPQSLPSSSRGNL